MSECRTGSAPAGRRSASMAGRRFCCPRSGPRLTSQATISLLAMSYTGARYALEPATLNSVTSVPSLANGLSAVKSRSGRSCTRSPVSPLYELYLLHGFPERIGHLSPMRRMTLSTLLADTFWPNSWTRHMRTCRWPHPLAVRPRISRTNGSRSGRVVRAGWAR